MNKITNWFKGYFGTKDDEEETFEMDSNETVQSQSRTDFSRPLILDEDELETYGMVEPNHVESTKPKAKVSTRKDEEIIYHSSEIISPFHGIKKPDEVKKERPKSRPSSTKQEATIISPYFGSKKPVETKPIEKEEEVEAFKTKTQEIKLNIRFDEEEYPETFDELRDWYQDDEEK